MDSEILDPNKAVDLMSHDCARLLSELNGCKESMVVDSPLICVKTTKKAFPTSYKIAIDGLRERIKQAVNGRKYSVMEVKVKHLIDSDENFWGDNAKILAEVWILE